MKITISLFLVLVSVGMTFEDVGLSARNLGMTNLSASVLEAPSSFFSNPALLAPLTRPHVGAFYGRPGFASANYLGLFGTYDLGRRTALGAWWLGRFFTPLGTSDRSEQTLGLAFAREIMPDVGLGLSVKNSSALADTGLGARFPSGLGFDLGAYYVPERLKGLALGLSLSDLSFSGELPGLRFGVSTQLADLKPFTRPLLGADLVWRNRELGLEGGVETWIRDIIGLRVGVQGLPRLAVSVGVSVRTNRVEKTDAEVDYALNTSYADSAKQAHFVSALVALGDAHHEVKEIARRIAEEQSMRARESHVRAESARVAQAWLDLETEKLRLASERADIEKMRAEALATLGKIEGVKVQIEQDFIRITAEGLAINFESGRADIPVPGIRVLKIIGKFLLTYPDHPVTIEGHTDNVPIGVRLRSRYKDNQALSEARANVIRDYFVVVEELPPALFTAQGYGDTKPIADNSSEEGRYKNRRVEITVSR